MMVTFLISSIIKEMTNFELSPVKTRVKHLLRCSFLNLFFLNLNQLPAAKKTIQKTSIPINVLFFLFCESFSVFKTFQFISCSKLSWHILKKSAAAGHYCKNAAVECCQRQIGCFDLLCYSSRQVAIWLVPLALYYTL